MAVEIASDATMAIPIPYHMQPEQLVLDPAVDKDAKLSEEFDRAINFLKLDDEEEMVHVLLGTVLAYFAGAGTLGQCFQNSVIWWRG